jgi:hypothetical protein
LLDLASEVPISAIAEIRAGVSKDEGRHALHIEAGSLALRDAGYACSSG